MISPLKGPATGTKKHKIAFQREEPSPTVPGLCFTCGNGTSEQPGGTGGTGATSVSSGESDVMRKCLNKVGGGACVSAEGCMFNACRHVRVVVVGLSGCVGFNGIRAARGEGSRDYSR